MSEEKRAIILHPTRFGLAEDRRRDFVVTAEDGTNIADVLNPGFWAHTATEMEDYSRVEVRIDTGEWLLELLVIEHGRNWARVKLLQKYDLVKAETSAEKPSLQHRVEYKGPHLKHCVVRNSDEAIILDSISTKVEAHQKMMEFESRMAIST